MTQQEWVALIADAGTVVLAACSLGGILFCAIYTALARWWKSREGRYIFGLSATLAVMCGYVLGAQFGWFGTLDDLGRVVGRLIVYAAVLALIGGLGYLLLRAQLGQYRRNRHPHDHLNRKDDHGRMG